MKFAARGLLLVASAHAAACGGGGITPIRTPFNRGVYLYSTGDYDQAIAEYRQALEEEPADYRARFNLAVALEASAAEHAAAGDAEAGERLRAAAEAEYRALAEGERGELRASINLAALEFERGERAAARARLQALLAAHPEVTLVRTALAAQRLAEKDAQGAVELLTAAVRRDPGSLTAQRLLGDALRVLGEVDRARAAYRQALRRDAADPGTLLALGQLELEAGRADEAAVWLARLLLIDPDHHQGHLLQSRAMEQLGELEEATLHLWLARRSAKAGDDAGTSQRLVELYRRLLEGERR